jgi:hypothetical protein
LKFFDGFFESSKKVTLKINVATLYVNIVMTFSGSPQNVSCSNKIKSIFQVDYKEG